MKTILFAAAALFAVSAVPALAGEGNGDPFGLVAPGVTTTFGYAAADAGSNSYAYEMEPGMDNQISGDPLNSVPASSEVAGRDYAVQVAPQSSHAVKTASRTSQY
jgi:hypothetical protein